MSRKYFGTDGVRGPFGGPVINEEFAARLARAAVVACGFSAGATVLIGRDTRSSGGALEAAVARGVRAAGARPILLGVLPTPAVARAVQTLGAGLGVVITASHNPSADNGIKFFNSTGAKLTDKEEEEIEGLLGPTIAPDGEVAESSTSAVSNYVNAAQTLISPGALTGWRVVLDTANGATCGTSPKVLRALGAEILAIGDSPNGENINENVGSEHPELLSEKVRSSGAQLGIAHDGDGDRCVLCDESGGVLDGDEILTILALHALEHGRLTKNTLVVTMQSNLGVDAALAARGGRVLRTSIGDRYVSECMRRESTILGGESSGHIICADISPTGDGLVAALKVIEVMLVTGKPLSELRRALKRFPQRTSALKVREKLPLDSLPALAGEISRLEADLGSHGRVLVRYSGTEAKLRLLIEGATDKIVQDGLARLEAAARANLVVL